MKGAVMKRIESLVWLVMLVLLVMIPGICHKPARQDTTLKQGTEYVIYALFGCAFASGLMDALRRKTEGEES